jgi:hypothetical protein
MEDLAIRKKWPSDYTRQPTYGPQSGNDVRCIEPFEACAYGALLDDAARHTLFQSLD